MSDFLTTYGDVADLHYRYHHPRQQATPDIDRLASRLIEVMRQLDEIEQRHQPEEYDGWPEDGCGGMACRWCEADWPCADYLTIHPEYMDSYGCIEKGIE